MLTPEQLDALPEAALELWRQVEEDILADMARRISRLGGLTDTATWQAFRLEQTQLFRRDLVKRLSQTLGKSEAEIRRLLTAAGTQALAADDAIYRAAGLSPVPPNDSPALLNLLTAGARQTQGTFVNLTATTANTATGQFERALDRAWLQTASGAFDYQTAVRRCISDLAASGLEAVRYPSGHVDTLEVAVRRAVITGVNQTAGRLQAARMEEMGCDLVEVTAHAGARPSHAEWQGKIFSRLGTHPKYPPFSRTGYGTGAGLCGWNCRHNFYPFFEGLSEPVYTEARLNQLNARDIEYQGRKYTRYEINQMQRYRERRVRRWKRQFVMEEAAGLDSTQTALRLKDARQSLSGFIAETGGQASGVRTMVQGFGRKQGSSAVWKAKKSVLQDANIVEGKNVAGVWKRRPEFVNEIDDIVSFQGYNGTPKVLSAPAFDLAVQKDHFVAKRTYTAATRQQLDEYANQLRKGEWYINCSVGGAQYGQGMYCAADYTKGRRLSGVDLEMEHYARLGRNRGFPFSRTETITLDESAKIFSVPGKAKVTRLDLIKQAAREYVNSKPELFGLSLEDVSSSSDAYHQAVYQMANDILRQKRELGAVITELGYDAINARGHGESGSYTVILNRTKMILRE